VENALELTHGCVKKKKEKERRRQESLVDFTDPMDWNHSEIKFQIVIFFTCLSNTGNGNENPNEPSQI
jgi:hypothetical protein